MTDEITPMLSAIGEAAARPQVEIFLEQSEPNGGVSVMLQKAGSTERKWIMSLTSKGLLLDYNLKEGDLLCFSDLKLKVC